MKVDRRKFIKHLALIAAGSAALPAQIQAFEKYYEENTPRVFDDLIAVDEIMISGLGGSSLPVDFVVYEGAEMQLSFAINLFGGILRWVAAPDQKIILDPIDLRIETTVQNVGELKRLKREIRGHVSYVDRQFIRHTDPIMNHLDIRVLGEV